ncbi:twin-arginine translocase subunit TatC [Allorhizocola rhizosphaerae]|uniref:twin-arginine translocase subunit TatC n=1 Tax=Allorhizocola rhizosphaerae TaxID=1872709 RepID=UPI003CCC509F
MTLMEHIRELRNRLFKAALGVAVGLVVGFILSKPVFLLLQAPYCELLLEKGNIDTMADCAFTQLGPADAFILRLKVALWLALIVSAPVWLYQLWAFIAPGLHRHERKWAYWFVALAAPLFAAGAFLAYFVAGKGLGFLMESGLAGVSTLEITKYTSFMTGMILLFGVSFEFPLILLMLNFAGVLTGRRMLKWWRVAVFVAFAFAAVTTPDPGPFGMSLFAGVLSLLYFITVGVAMLNDRRKGRGKEIYEGLDDDETSSLEGYEPEPVEAGPPIEPSIAPLERRYDDMT